MPDDYADLPLLIEALTGYAAIRERAAKRASAELEHSRKAGADTRTGSVKVTRMLAEAAALERTADALLSGQLLPPAPPAPEPAPAPAAAPATKKRGRRTAQEPPAAAPKAKGPRVPMPAIDPASLASATQGVGKALNDALAPIRKAARDAGVVMAAENEDGTAAEDEPTPADVAGAFPEEGP